MSVPPQIPKRSLAVVGVDPGVSGAIGVLGPDTRFLEVHDLPVIGVGRKGEFDADALFVLASGIALKYNNPLVRLEWPATRPDEAAESSKRFGVGLGLLWGVFIAVGCEVERVAPNGWKGRLGLSGKAGQARYSRQQAADAVRGPRGGLLDGRAEALLIAFEHVSRTQAGLRAMDPHIREARMLMGGKRRRKN